MKLIATSIACACIISTGVGFAFGRVSEPPVADAASAEARTLRQIERELVKLNRNVGLTESSGLRGQVDDVGDEANDGFGDLYRGLAKLCDAQTDSDYRCPSSLVRGSRGP